MNSDSGERKSANTGHKPNQGDSTQRGFAETAAFGAPGGDRLTRTGPITNGGRTPKPSAAGKSEPVPDEIAGRFRIRRALGRGGMGAVYLAEDTQLHRQVALKIPRIEDDSSEISAQRFMREARAAATLNHPNICPIYDVGRDGNTHFIAMGFVEGKPLSAYISAAKPQPARQVANVVRKIALALEAAHAKGILHRDLKPANIMIDKRGEPIVMDFGLACRVDHEAETRLTQDGVVLGTPGYMAPEQIDGRGRVGPASDLYSLGVLMYELLSGQCAFKGSLVSIIGQVLHTEPTPLADLRPDVPPALAGICSRAMAKDPNRRFASMKEFASALADFLKGSPASSQSAALAVPDTVGGLDELLSSASMVGLSEGAPLRTLPARKSASQANPKLLWAVGGGALLLGLAVCLLLFATGNSVVEQDTPEASAAPSASLTAGQTVAPVDRSSTAAVNDGKATAISNDAPLDPTASTIPPGSPPATPGELTQSNEIEQVAPFDKSPAVVSTPRRAAPQSIADTPPPPFADRPFAGERDQSLSFGDDVPDGPPHRADGPAAFEQGRPEEGVRDDSDLADVNSFPKLKEFFERRDTNHDWKLDPREVPLHVIMRADTNGDRLLTPDELKRAFEQQKQRLFAKPSFDEMKRLPRRPPGGEGEGQRPPEFGPRRPFGRPPR